MIIRGRMMQDCKMFIAYDILRSSIFFWYTYRDSMYVHKKCIKPINLSEGMTINSGIGEAAKKVFLLWPGQ